MLVEDCDSERVVLNVVFGLKKENVGVDGEEEEEEEKGCECSMSRRRTSMGWLLLFSETSILKSNTSRDYLIYHKRSIFLFIFYFCFMEGNYLFLI